MGIDVVPPWELIPIPPNPIEDNDVRGLIRHRTVPLDWVRSLSIEGGPGPKHKIWDNMVRVTYPKAQKPAKTNKGMVLKNK